MAMKTTTKKKKTKANAKPAVKEVALTETDNVTSKVKDGEQTAPTPNDETHTGDTETDVKNKAIKEPVTSEDEPIDNGPETAEEEMIPDADGRLSLDDKDTKNLASNLNTYLERMSKGVPHEPKDGLMYQKSLFAVVTNVLNTADHALFKKRWALLLEFALMQRTHVFADDMIARYLNAWDDSEKKFNTFVALLMVIKDTCDPKAKDTISKRVDFNKILNNDNILLSPVATSNLVKFYNIT